MLLSKENCSQKSAPFTGLHPLRQRANLFIDQLHPAWRAHIFKISPCLFEQLFGSRQIRTLAAYEMRLRPFHGTNGDIPTKLICGQGFAILTKLSPGRLSFLLGRQQVGLSSCEIQVPLQEGRLAALDVLARFLQMP